MRKRACRQARALLVIDSDYHSRAAYPERAYVAYFGPPLSKAHCKTAHAPLSVLVAWQRALVAETRATKRP